MPNTDKEIEKILGVCEYKEVDDNNHVLNDRNSNGKDMQIRFKDEGQNCNKNNVSNNTGKTIYSSLENSKPFHNGQIMQSTNFNSAERRIIEDDRSVYSNIGKDYLLQNGYNYSNEIIQEGYDEFQRNNGFNNSSMKFFNNTSSDIVYGDNEISNNINLSDRDNNILGVNSFTEFKQNKLEDKNESNTAFDLESILGLGFAKSIEANSTNRNIGEGFCRNEQSDCSDKNTQSYPVGAESSMYSKAKLYRSQEMNSPNVIKNSYDQAFVNKDFSYVKDERYNNRNNLYPTNNGQNINEILSFKSPETYNDYESLNNYMDRNGNSLIKNSRSHIPYIGENKNINNSIILDSLSNYNKRADITIKSRYTPQGYVREDLQMNNLNPNYNSTSLLEIKNQYSKESNPNDPLLFRNPSFFQYNFNPNAYNRVKRRRRLNSNTCIHTSGKMLHPSQLSSIDYVFGNMNSQLEEHITSDCCDMPNLGSPGLNRSELNRSIEYYKKKLNAIDFDNITVLELKSLMKNFGVNPNGKKQEMIERLQQKIKEIYPSTDSPNRIPKAKEENGTFDGFFF